MSPRRVTPADGASSDFFSLSSVKTIRHGDRRVQEIGQGDFSGERESAGSRWKLHDGRGLSLRRDFRNSARREKVTRVHVRQARREAGLAARRQGRGKKQRRGGGWGRRRWERGRRSGGTKVAREQRKRARRDAIHFGGGVARQRTGRRRTLGMRV